MITVIWNIQIWDVCSESKKHSYRRDHKFVFKWNGQNKLIPGTYTCSNKSKCLLTIFERGKMRMVEFKARISKNESNKCIFDPITREKWKSFEDTVKRTTKTKIDSKIKDIVEQKNILGLLAAKSDQSKSVVDIKNALCSSHLPLFHDLLLSRWCEVKNKKIWFIWCNWFTIKSQHTTGKLHWFQLFICRCSCRFKSSKKCTKDVRRFSN